MRMQPCIRACANVCALARAHACAHARAQVNERELAKCAIARTRACAHVRADAGACARHMHVRAHVDARAYAIARPRVQV
jgi:hypothetical protein